MEQAEWSDSEEQDERRSHAVAPEPVLESQDNVSASTRPSCAVVDQSDAPAIPQHSSHASVHAHERSGAPQPKQRKKTSAPTDASASSSSFPTPFKCSGDFCGFVLHEPSPLRRTHAGAAKPFDASKRFSVSAAMESSSEPTALHMLFPLDEAALVENDALRSLVLSRRDQSAVAVVPTPTSSAPKPHDTTELHVITYKSIALGKANREHLALRLETQARSDADRLRQELRTDKLAGKTSGKTQGAKASRRSSLLDSTAAHEFRQGSRLRMYGDMGDGVASYYRQVRVCSDCYAIYTLLDAARRLKTASESTGTDLDKHKPASQNKQQQKLKDEWNKHVAQELEAKERLYLRKSHAAAGGGSNSHAKSVITAAPDLDEAPGSLDIDALKLESVINACAPAREGTLPALVSPKTPGSLSHCAASEDSSIAPLRSPNGSESSPPPSQQQLSQLTSMPVLSSASRSSSTSSLDRAPVTKPSCFALPSSSDAPVSKVALTKSSAVFKGLDRYLRGESKVIEEPVLAEGQLFRSDVLPSATADVATAARRSRPKTPSDVATVLLVDSDAKSLEALHRSLSAISRLALEIESMVDLHEALGAAKTFPYDLILCEREFTSHAAASKLTSGLEFVRLLRQFELQQSIASSRAPVNKALGTTAPPPHRTTVVCVTSQTSREDLQLYRDAGIDGCIGKPLNQDSLERTVLAALAKVAASTARTSRPGSSSTTAVASATEALARAKREQQERKRRRRRRIEASSALPFPGLADMDARDDYVAGTFQMDAATSMPFCVLGNVELQPQHVPNTFFNLVVVHDLFDTWERLQILLRPILARYHGAIQILVWNYPGQAYTTWRPGTLLNNAYHTQCLHALLQHVGVRGLGIWRDAPYYLMGIGNGGSIATAFCTHAPPLDPNTRALLLVNAFAFVDAQLAQFLHDCLKVFACTPASRPDLPVYFHTRFLFSSAYLARVSTPLALNLYTAVMNPITLDGRRALCHGALTHVDPVAASGVDAATRLRVPLLNVCSAQNALLDAGAQAQKLVQLCGLDVVDSIGKVLRQTTKRKRHSCIVWLPGGHEVLQECKQDMLLLLEQLVTGYHESTDAAIKPLGAMSFSSLAVAPLSSSVGSGSGLTKPGALDALHRSKKANATRDEDDVHGHTHASSSSNSTKGRGNASGAFEDAFIDNVLSTVKDVVTGGAAPEALALRPSSSNGSANNQVPSPERAKWTQFQHERAQKATATLSVAKALASVTGPGATSALGQHAKTQSATSPSKLVAMTSWDPTTPAFERLSSNVIYKVGEGSKIYPDVRAAAGSKGTAAHVPELKEYMEWRVKRNQKRLQRMTKQARVIQRAFRAFYARTLLLRIKQTRCAIALQRLWRAKLARKKYKGMKKEDWAARLLQRHWRGKMGRDSYRDRFRKYLAAVDIQRIARGFLATLLVARMRHRLHTSAAIVQCLVRQYLAKRRAFHRRLQRNSAMTIQRVFRGHVGRKRFAHEQSKFLYAQTQSQGIAFGKQLLLEYKLYGTKLQSDVTLLAQAKTDVEAQAESLVNEICEFDEGIRLLETEMHALSRVETEALAGKSGSGMDEQGKWALREQKMRLDREFTQMLAQIALRKEKLSVLEEKLQALDKERLSKEEELKSLERKLVVLLDEQQQELEKIKQKQQTRQQLVLDLTGTPGKSLATTTGSPSWSSFPSSGALTPGSAFQSAAATAGVNSSSAFTQQQREEANALMESTETMMKFGFMSMSMTYFSSMNMVRAMRKIGAHHMTLDSAAAVSNKHWPEYTLNRGAPGAVASPLAGGAASPFGGATSAPNSFQPAIPNGSFPGQQPLQVAGWSVADVGRWLDTLALGQYTRAFADAAVDGALLLHLNDDDLKNTLGMEHRLHRKKVLTSVEQLREAERIKMLKLYGANQPDSLPSSPVATSAASPARAQPSASGGSASLSIASLAALGPVGGSRPPAAAPATLAAPSESESVSTVAGANLKVVVAFPEFCTLVRHGKLKQLKEALANVPDRRFDALTVLQPFSPGVGTVYDDLLEKSAFHINKSDENGNSPLLLAAQNNNLKVAQLLIAKGANPNHQNVRVLVCALSSEERCGVFLTFVRNGN